MAEDRSVSPTRSCFEMRQQALQKLGHMASLGLHIFNPNWNREGFVMEDGDVVKAAHFHSGSFKDCTLRIQGSAETLTIPVQTCTKVFDVKCAVANHAMVSPDDLTFVVKQGCTWRVQNNTEEIARTVVVKGIVAFQPQPHKWPHPTIILGAGYNGIKVALFWATEGNTDFHMYEKYDSIGGHAWLVQANKTSKLQTEMGAFHIWFGMHWGAGNPKLSFPVEWGTWPKKDEVIAHIRHAAEVYGITPQISFQHEATDMHVVGKLSDWDRTYQISVAPKANRGDQFEVTTNILVHFPGAYFNPRIIDYPGQDEADLQIGYGMNDDMPYDYLEGNRGAILGNGAFAVENIRTCMEYGMEKVYLVTRKKNLPSPRMCCWFVHQSQAPVPARMLLDLFIPMFDQCGFGNPWDYHSVYASKNRDHCTINSHSRFGIGDVTFLAVAWGRCEYVVDVLKRCTHHTLHLAGGRKLEDIRVVVKALGLIADWGADRFHKIKEMIGFFPAGDHRRTLYADPVGMHAANFASFSTGIGSYLTAMRDKHLADFPQEFLRLQAMGALDMLPRHKADMEQDQPAHQFDAKYATSCSMVVDSFLPRFQAKIATLDQYFHTMMWTVNPFEKYFAECKASWDQYQVDWWKMGFEHEYVPYPYTREIVHGWFDRYKNTIGPIELPGKDYAPKGRIETYIPSWDRDAPEVAPVEEGSPPEEERPQESWAHPEPQSPQEQPQGQPQEQPQLAEQRQDEQQQQQAPSDEDVIAYCRSLQGSELEVVEPVIGSIFNELAWDRDGSRDWWRTWGRTGRGWET